MLKITINDVVQIPREVELPTKCPNCGLALTITGLIERQLVRTTQYCRPRYEDAPLDNDATWGMAFPTDSYIVTGYCCSKCDHELAVGTENIGTPDSPKPELPST